MKDFTTKAATDMMTSNAEVVKPAVAKGKALVGEAATPSWQQGRGPNDNWQHVVVWAGKKLLRPGYAQNVRKSLEVLDKAGDVCRAGKKLLNWALGHVTSGIGCF